MAVIIHWQGKKKKWIKALLTFDNLKLISKTYFIQWNSQHRQSACARRTCTVCWLTGCVTLLSISGLALSRFLKHLFAMTIMERLVLWWRPDTETLTTREDLEWTRKDVKETARVLILVSKWTHVLLIIFHFILVFSLFSSVNIPNNRSELFLLRFSVTIATPNEARLLESALDKNHNNKASPNLSLCSTTARSL